MRAFDQLILVPFYLLAWGSHFYGEWLILMAVPTILAFSELGFGTAAANSYVYSFAGKQNEEAGRIAYNGYVAITGAIVFAIVATALVLAGLEHYGFFSQKAIPERIALWSIATAVGARIICFYHPLIDSHYISIKKNYICINFQTTISAAAFISAIVVLKTTKNPIHIAAAQLIINSTATALYYLSTRRTRKITTPNSARLDRATLMTLAKKGTSYFLSPVWQVAFFQGTTLAVDATLGPSAVAAFNTARAATRSANQVYAMIVTGFLSEIQLAIGQGNMEKTRRLHATSVALIFPIAALGTIFLTLWGTSAYEVWTQKTISLPPHLLPLLSFGLLLNALWWPTSFLFQAANHPEILAKAGLVSASISVAMTYVLCSYFGLTGAAFGSLTLELLLILFITPAGCRLIGQPLTKFPRDAARAIGDMLRRHRAKNA